MMTAGVTPAAATPKLPPMDGASRLKLEELVDARAKHQDRIENSDDRIAAYAGTAAMIGGGVGFFGAASAKTGFGFAATIVSGVVLGGLIGAMAASATHGYPEQDLAEVNRKIDVLAGAHQLDAATERLLQGDAPESSPHPQYSFRDDLKIALAAMPMASTATAAGLGGYLATRPYFSGKARVAFGAGAVAMAGATLLLNKLPERVRDNLKGTPAG